MAELKKKKTKRFPLKPDKEEKRKAFETDLPFFQRKWVKNSLWVLAFILFYLGLRAFQQGDIIKDRVPPVKLVTLTGQEIDLSKPQPRPYLIHFWGAWCPICNYQHDDIRKLSEEYFVITIAVKTTSEEELRLFAKEHFIPKSIIVNDLYAELMNTFKVTAVPTDFYVKPNGEIMFVETGFTSYWGFKLRLWWLENWGT